MQLSLPVCENMGDIYTVAYYATSFAYTSVEFNCSCPTPCKLIHYSAEVLPAEYEMAFGKSKVSIYMPENAIEVLTESPAYDFIQMVGEFGGSLGLFLGVSLVSLYEFLDRFIRSRCSKIASNCL